MDYERINSVRRRGFLAATIGLFGLHGLLRAQEASPTMYGLIVKMNAVSGQRDTLVEILLESSQPLPGNLSYVVAADPTDPDGLWITEAWDSAESHKASLKLDVVQTTIAKARPLIAGFSNRVETLPLGGHGLKRAPL
jgi:quinol monooxygenase YgiN